MRLSSKKNIPLIGFSVSTAKIVIVTVLSNSNITYFLYIIRFVHFYIFFVHSHTGNCTFLNHFLYTNTTFCTQIFVFCTQKNVQDELDYHCGPRWVKRKFMNPRDRSTKGGFTFWTVPNRGQWSYSCNWASRPVNT